MTIYSKRERDRLAREQQDQLDAAHKRHMESLDALDKMWRDSAAHNQDIIDRTTKGMGKPDFGVDINHIEVEYD